MSVLITGAGGFLGGWLAHGLAARDEVIAWSRDEHVSTLDLLGAGAAVRVRGDVRDAATWDRLLVRYRPQVIVHLAAESQVRRARALPRETWTANLMGTLEALEAARRHTDTVRGVIVASSDKAYGPAKYLPYDEDHPLQAIAPYDASKAAADLCARSYAVTYQLPLVVVRAANLYGGGDLNRDRIIPETCRAILEGRDVVLRSDGTPERDYLHVEDAARGYEALIDRASAGSLAPGRVYNFGTGTATSVRDLVAGIIAAAGAAGERTKVTYAAPDVKGELDRQAVAFARARAELGWEPRHALRAGLELTWQWYERHWSRWREA